MEFTDLDSDIIDVIYDYLDTLSQIRLKSVNKKLNSELHITNLFDLNIHKARKMNIKILHGCEYIRALNLEFQCETTI